MNLIALRHGETTMNKEERLQGSTGPDLPLTEAGRKAIETLRDGLLVIPVGIYASPLKRAVETANIINERFGLDIIVRDELKERDFGTLSGKLKSEVDQAIIEADLEGRYDYHPYGGESVDDVKKRVKDFLVRLPIKSSDTVIAVTHRGVIRVLYDLFPTDTMPADIFPGTKHVFRITEIPA